MHSKLRESIVFDFEVLIVMLERIAVGFLRETPECATFMDIKI